MAKISKDMLINDILEVDAGNAAILMAAGMHCIGCMAAAGESLEEAAAVHGLDAEELEQEINEYLAKKRTEGKRIREISEEDKSGKKRRNPVVVKNRVPSFFFS